MNLTRPTHVRILKFLQTLNPDLLVEMECFFGGGTAISMLNSEFRLSVDVDFLCATGEGYALLRNTIFEHGFQALFKEGMAPKLLREVKADQYGVRALVDLDGMPLKFEIIREARVDLEPRSRLESGLMPVATLSEVSLFTEKLLANADRGLDKSGLSKDMIDLIVMQHHWGQIPIESVRAAVKAYGPSIGKSYAKTFVLLRDNAEYLNRCLNELSIENEYKQIALDYISDPANAEAVNQLVDKLKNRPANKSD